MAPPHPRAEVLVTSFAEGWLAVDDLDAVQPDMLLFPDPDSAFLDPLPASAEAPPGWPYATLTDLGCANEITTNPGAGATAQVTFANKFTVAGAPTEITIWERTLNPTTGLYRREFRVDIPYNDGTVVMPTFVPPATEDEVYVATYLTTGGARCIGVVRATANPSRWVIEAPAAP